jgi:hypothetical protein
MKHEISTEQMNEYLLLKSTATKDRVKSLEEIARLFIKNQIRFIHKTVSTKKYDKSAWLEQYNLKVKEGRSNRRIDSLCEELGYTSRNLSEDEKAEVGFHLLMDYLKELYEDLSKAKSCSNSKSVYKNIGRESEALHLFYNPLTLKDLDEAFTMRKKHLARVGAELNSNLLEADESLKTELNDAIKTNTKAIASLKTVYESLKANWDLKVNPLVPYLDDRKLRFLKIKNETLKELAVKPESNLSAGSKPKLIPPSTK